MRSQVFVLPSWYPKDSLPLCLVWVDPEIHVTLDTVSVDWQVVELQRKVWIDPQWIVTWRQGEIILDSQIFPKVHLYLFGELLELDRGTLFRIFSQPRYFRLDEGLLVEDFNGRNLRARELL